MAALTKHIFFLNFSNTYPVLFSFSRAKMISCFKVARIFRENAFTRNVLLKSEMKTSWLKHMNRGFRNINPERQKQSSRGVTQERYSQEFCKIYRKTALPEPLF